MKQLSFIILLFFLISCSGENKPAADRFIKGADISSLMQIEDAGGIFRDNGTAADCLQILKKHGINYIRLRIWHTPTNNYCTKEKTIAMAKRVKALGLRLLLDFHYSDHWADPGQQSPPTAWTGMDYSQISNQVYIYTKDIITSLKVENALPDMVQIGNEITPGMLWPHGQVGGFDKTHDNIYIRGSFNSWEKSWMPLVAPHVREITLSGISPSDTFKFDGAGDWSLQWGETNNDGMADIVTNATGNISIPSGINGQIVIQFNETNLAYSVHTNASISDLNWNRLTGLLKAGISGVKDSLTAKENIKIMLHLDRGADNASCRSFFDRITASGIEFDIIGLSYYNWWHGNLDQMQDNINDLALRYGKDIIIVETSYPWTLGWNDSVNNQVGLSNQLHDKYPASVAGQKAFLQNLISRIRQTPDNRGIGLFYWEPAWITTSSAGSCRENQALFDFNGNVLDSLNAFQE